MSDNFEPVYSELQSEPDNIEIIRDQIAALLALELKRQHEIAVEKEDSAAQDYDVDVYIENSDPLQYVDDTTPDANPFPCVNVLLESSDSGKGTATVNKQCLTAQFFIDCYAAGNAASTDDFGTVASKKAWKTARLVRRILRAEPNTYLRLRGVVGKVDWKFQSGEPASPQSAIRVKMVRITLTIDYVEDVEVTQGIIDWDIEGIITDDSGRVLFGPPTEI